jgi:cell division protein FtsB
MLEFQRKQKTRHILFSKGAIIICLIMCFFLGKGVLGLYSKAQASAEARKVSEHELQELQERTDFVEGEISRLRTTEGVEREIREKFSVAKPGEELVVVVPATPEEAPEIKPSLFKRIWEKTKTLWYNEPPLTQ